MSGLLAEVSQPRAVVLALHGGASDPVYFDTPGFPELSLVRLAADLGYTVIAPHRLGYGSSRQAAYESAAPDLQVSNMQNLLKALLRDRADGAGVFLMGHSQGCVLAMRMAAAEGGSDLLGVGLSGTGMARSARAEVLTSARTADPAMRREMRDILGQPAHLYPQGVAVTGKAPAYDVEDARTWTREFADIAPRITVPVHVGLGDHESFWEAGPSGLERMASRFTGSPRVVTEEQVGAGHNISAGLAARAYHLKVLAFVEECVLAQSRAGRIEQVMEPTDV